MNSDNHKHITAAALSGFGLQDSTINLICTADIDSDTKGCTEGSWLSQHFSRQKEIGDQNVSIANAMEFRIIAEKLINEQFDKLWEEVHLLSSPDTVFHEDLCKDVDYLLYCIGRACHNVQDFYAHSNWIWLKAEEGLPNGSPWGFDRNGIKGLKLSTWGGVKYELGVFAFGGVAFLNNEKVKKDILNKNCTHAWLNLDCKYTHASNAYYSSYRIHGYDVAKELAKQDTIKFWRNILTSEAARKVVFYLNVPSHTGMNKVKTSGLNWVKKIPPLRNKFALDMKRLGMPF